MGTTPPRGPGPGGVEEKYSDDVLLEILHRHAQGETLLNILRDPLMPDWNTFYRRVRGPSANDMLKAADREARASYATHKSEELMQLADEDPVVAFSALDAGGKGDKEVVRVDSAAVQWMKLRVDTRKWLVAKVLPVLYGDRVAVANPDGSPIATPVLSITVRKE